LFNDLNKWKNDSKGDDDMLDKLIAYVDGDVGAALTYSQNFGIPMVRVTKDTLESVLKKYPAKKTYIIGIDGKDAADRVYISAGNRLKTAQELFTK